MIDQIRSLVSLDVDLGSVFLTLCPSFLSTVYINLGVMRSLGYNWEYEWEVMLKFILLSLKSKKE